MSVAHERTKRLLRFLKEYAAIRFPPTRDLDEVRWKLWLDGLPQHSSIAVLRITGDDEREGNGNDGPEVLMRIRRPRLSRPPALPPSLEGWLKGAFDDPFKEPEVLTERSIPDSDGASRAERFEEDPVRVREWHNWLERWRTWAQQERPARQAMKVYERFYELYGELQREGERYELTLADGILFWRWRDGLRDQSIYYPLLLLPVQLEFQPDVPEFLVRETDRNPELHTTILRDAPLSNPTVLSSLHDEVTQDATFLHPLEGPDTTAFLKSLAPRLAPDGEFTNEPIEPQKISGPHPPRIWRSPVLLLLPRTQGYARAVERVLDDLEQRDDPPTALCSVVGIHSSGVEAASPDPHLSGSTDDLDVLRDVFFTKPWNAEQLQIAARLKRYGCVLVQGPPGTGKTHTIANLIGHLLAEGKSVLVTAYTSKALRVVRKHIPEPLRPLAVSVLDDDLASRRQLEEAVAAITSRLNDDASSLRRRAAELKKQRDNLLREIARLRTALVEAIGSEYRSIVIAGREYAPSEAARRVAEGVGQNDWIPEPIESGVSLPLSPAELAELYRLNRDLPEEEERQLRAAFPDPQTLLLPDAFQELTDLLRESPEGYQAQWWHRNPTVEDIPVLQETATAARELGELLLAAQQWELVMIESSEAALFDQHLFRPAETLVQFQRDSAHLLITHQPSLPPDGALEEHEQTANALAETAKQRGGSLSWRDALWPSRHRRFVKSARVAGGQPKTVEHFQALAAEAAIQRQRQQLRSAWAYLITQHGGPSADDLGPQPEHAILQRASRIRRLLSVKEEIDRLQDKLRSLGFNWDRACGESPLQRDAEHHLRGLGQFLSDTLPEALTAMILVLRQRDAKRRIQEAKKRLGAPSPGTAAAALRDALDRRDAVRYRAAYARLCELHEKHVYLRRREELLERLSRFAPAWAEVVRARRGLHGGDELPGDPETAWLWRQLHQELVHRSETSIQEIQTRLEQRMEQLYKITAQLVECSTWAHRIEKTGPRQRQALVGWLNTMRRLGKGTGRSAPRLRAEASRLLARAKEAVPVWIMPLARVAEQIDPATTRFDVVIVDEASQCDLLGLLALYAGDQVVVVGDHEQVSPEGVGQELRAIERLQAEYLRDIPNAHLYDGRRSIYDLARESFGGAIMLTEHFRCVPEIIAFSNRLSYGGRIRPLRESGSVPLKPAVIPHRVKGTAHEKVNEEEAATIAALILAMLRHPAYDGKTIGVISMIGDEQAKLIERLVRQACLDDPKLERELEGRRLLCGNPAQFQGDERDVVLISLVDSPRPEGPLPLRNDDRFKQRFNVAASRARDQLWVVYSLDPAADLKEGDLRRELIEFAWQAFKDPEGLLHDADANAERTESPFERDVLEWLRDRGYRVRAQWPVGSYRIDLVVEGEHGRVAIECDGDRWHPIEKIPEDLERQAVLERLGWRFIRIRGSEFYRDREGTMQRVVRELERLGIRPGGRFSVPEDEGEDAPPHPLVEEIIRMAERIKAGERLEAIASWRPVPSDAGAPERSLAISPAARCSTSKPGTRPSSGDRGRALAAHPEPIPSTPQPLDSSRVERKSRPPVPLSADEREELRAQLLQKRDGLREELQEVERRIRTSEFSWARESAAQRRASLKEELRLVEDTLHRLDTEDYGICTRCGQPIPIERLRALPFARLCIRCQGREDAVQMNSSRSPFGPPEREDRWRVKEFRLLSKMRD
ncbi:MAG: AAA domain-containing protein [Candidatus Caldarchaeum sp.]